MDAQIWYAIFSTLFGGIYGAFRRLGEVWELASIVSLFVLITHFLCCWMVKYLSNCTFYTDKIIYFYHVASRVEMFILFYFWFLDSDLRNVKIAFSIAAWCFQCLFNSRGEE